MRHVPMSRPEQRRPPHITGNPIVDDIADFLLTVIAGGALLLFVAGVFFLILGLFGVDV